MKLYRALLLAYPAEFRHEYAAEMERLFAERLRSEPRLLVWLETIADVGLTAPREHLSILAADLRHAVRLFAAAPAFTFVALLAIALGVGATTSVFSLLNAVLLRSLPYGDAERLVYLWEPNTQIQGLPRELSPFYSRVDRWRQMSHSFSSIAAFRMGMQPLNRDRSRRIAVSRVSGNFFRTLEAEPELGRTIGEQDDQAGREPVAVISDAFWRAQFGGDPEALGKTVRLGTEIYRIIGIMAPEFGYPHGNDFRFGNANIKRTDVWTALALTPQERANENDTYSAAIARLKPGLSTAQAQVEIAGIEKTLDTVPLGGFKGWTAYIQPFIDAAVGPIRPLLWLLMGAVALVLLIACSNVANLLMARAATRAHEIGVRSALGAARPRLMRQMLTESLLLACGGGLLGLLLGAAIMKTVRSINPGNIPRLNEASLDSRILLFTLAVALLTGAIFGILPALSASRVNVADLLREGGSRSIAGASSRTRNLLIITEVALSVILVTGAGLLVRSYRNVLAVDTGFSPLALRLHIELPDRYQTPAQKDVIYRDLLARIRRLPGVQAVGAISALPFTEREQITTVAVKGYSNQPGQTADTRDASPGYFQAMHIPLESGRLFTDADANDKPCVKLVSCSFEQRYFPGRSAIGGQLGEDVNAKTWCTIVGVVADIHHSSLEKAPKTTIYGPFSHYPLNSAEFVIRTPLPPGRISPAIHEAIRRLDPAVLPSNIQPLRELISESNSLRRFQTAVLASFAAVALFLALVGIYGLLAYSVKQRTSEIGVRIALGASRAAVIAMVLRQGLALTAVGVAIGLAGAFALTRVISAWLFGVAATDPLTFAVTPTALLVAASAACLIPAWRAARIDPVNALRRQ